MESSFQVHGNAVVKPLYEAAVKAAGGNLALLDIRSPYEIIVWNTEVQKRRLR
jgi:hypothetical protein